MTQWKTSEHLLAKATGVRKLYLFLEVQPTPQGRRLRRCEEQWEVLRPSPYLRRGGGRGRGTCTMASSGRLLRAAVAGVVVVVVLTQVLGRAHAGAARRKNSWWTKRSLVPPSLPLPTLDYPAAENARLGQNSYICFLNQELAASRADRDAGAADPRLYGMGPPCFIPYPRETLAHYLPPWNPRRFYAHARAPV
ncbi:uncharacterized protein LOC119586755 [Penaeus monodon]|uniref:uncharacterized protein LOC119586755 n=1 Tax=Penaeus monodon TaxID=6687 RepID=UPI0018A7B5DB|nr:uncharacterized protein LOC119586755 [Penaeus monodon]